MTMTQVSILIENNAPPMDLRGENIMKTARAPTKKKEKRKTDNVKEKIRYHN
jgi:hypothetical protein